MPAVVAPVASSQVAVTTYHNDIGRTGQNLQETILTPSNVNSNTFGQLFKVPVDGQVYAQPLYLPNLTVGGNAHNVLFIETERDSVYAFDADNGGLPIWQVTLTDAAHGAASGAAATPTLSNCDIGGNYYGITGTPVIDPSTGTMYVVSMTQENGYPVQRLHALDVTTGAEKFGGPTTISATVSGTGSGSVNGTLSFDPQWQLQRPGLLLLNGNVYIAWGSFCDLAPAHGWVMSYSASTLQQTGVFAVTPNGSLGGIWMAGAGLAADNDGPNGAGRLFIPTANGDYSATAPYIPNTMNFGDSIINFDLSKGLQSITDEFTPFNQALLSSQDADVGGGGALVVPDQPGSNPHLLINLGKGQGTYDGLTGGVIFVLNRDNLGGYNTTADNVLQRITVDNGERGMSAYWNGNVYFWPGAGEPLWQFSLTNGVLSTTPVAVSTYTPTVAEHTANPVISASGNTNGIVWSVDTSTTQPVLWAHDATNVANMLYSSSTNATRDTISGLSVPFSSATVANGKVYVGANYYVTGFGLLGTPGFNLTSAPASLSIAAGATATATINVVSSNGFNKAVTFSASGLPAGVTASFSPVSSASGSTTLTLTAAAGATLGTSSVTVTGVSGTLTQAVSVPVTVTAAPDFSLSPTPANLSFAPGASGTVSISVVPSGAFTGTVSFSPSGLPSGVTASFNPATSTTSTILTLSAAATATAGTTLITVTGTSGAITHTAAVSLTLTGGTPNFSLASSPASLTVASGASGTSTIAVTPANGFTGAVAFSASGLPSGVTASFSPASSNSASTLTLNVSPTAAAGTSTITITGTSGSLAHSTTVSLTITQAPTFTLSPSPTTVSIAQGSTGTATITVAPANGFKGSVTFSATGLPSGVTASFNPSSSTTSTTLTLTASSTAPLGATSITVNGVNGQLTHSATIELTVTAPTHLPVSLSSVFNVYGIFNNRTVPTHRGFDNDGYAYSENLLGTSTTWSGIPFNFGPSGSPSAVYGATINLPQGAHSSLNILAAAVNGRQINQSFVVTYTDGTSTTITRNLSDWALPQDYSGESKVLIMTYRVAPNGGTQNGTFYVYGYSLPLNSAKTVRSIRLPNNRNVVVLAMTF